MENLFASIRVAASWMAASDLKSLQNFLRRNWVLMQPLLFTYWLPTHLVFDSHLTQSVRLPMVTYPSFCSTCVTCRMSCHAIGHRVLLTQPLPKEAGDFSTGGNHSVHMPLLTYHLAWLQPTCHNPKFVFKHVKIEKRVDFNKKHWAAALITSSHESEKMK